MPLPTGGPMLIEMTPRAWSRLIGRGGSCRYFLVTTVVGDPYGSNAGSRNVEVVGSDRFAPFCACLLSAGPPGVEPVSVEI